MIPYSPSAVLWQLAEHEDSDKRHRRRCTICQNRVWEAVEIVRPPPGWNLLICSDCEQLIHTARKHVP